MTNIFEPWDRWESPLNMVRDHVYMRKVVFWFIVLNFFFWGLFGFDSGVGMIEAGLKAAIAGTNVKAAVLSEYGISFHFSSFIIYGLLYLGVSVYLEKNRIVKTGNVFISSCIVLFDVAIFELIYATLFAHFQMNRNLIEWFITDLWFIQQYLIILAVGVLGFYLVHKLGLRAHLHDVLFFSVFAAGVAFLFWIFYPFHVETAVFNGWVSSPLFPQTHYAYVVHKFGLEGSGYIPNPVLHSVNLLAKVAVAFVAYAYVRCFYAVADSD